MLNYLLVLYLATVFTGWVTIVPYLKTKTDSSKVILCIAWAVASLAIPVSTWFAVVKPNDLIKGYNE